MTDAFQMTITAFIEYFKQLLIQHIHIQGFQKVFLERIIIQSKSIISKYFIGNLTTLWTRPLEQNIDVRSALIKFHEDYYSSNIMTLAVLGIEPLDELCNLVTEIFHPIVNKNVALPTWTQPFSENQLQTIVYDVPNKDLRNLTLVFQIPDDRLKFYKTGVSINKNKTFRWYFTFMLYKYFSQSNISRICWRMKERAASLHY